MTLNKNKYVYGCTDILKMSNIGKHLRWKALKKNVTFWYYITLFIMFLYNRKTNLKSKTFLFSSNRQLWTLGQNWIWSLTILEEHQYIIMVIDDWLLLQDLWESEIDRSNDCRSEPLFIIIGEYSDILHMWGGWIISS